MYVNNHACTLENKNYQNQSHAQSFKTKKKKKTRPRKNIAHKMWKICPGIFCFSASSLFYFPGTGGKGKSLQRRRRQQFSSFIFIHFKKQ